MGGGPCGGTHYSGYYNSTPCIITISPHAHHRYVCDFIILMPQIQASNIKVEYIIYFFTIITNQCKKTVMTSTTSTTTNNKGKLAKREQLSEVGKS